jgi:phosphoglycolate phosphatase-like HAD superfamily hydrolase
MPGCTVAYDLVVFDLDGTIVDSDEAMAIAFERAYRQVYPTAKEVPLRELQIRQGIPLQQIVQELGWRADLSLSFKKESLGQIDKVRLFPDVGGVLDILHRMNVKSAILTGKDRERTLALLERFSIVGLFAVIVCGDDPFRGKPFPDGLNHIIDVTDSCRERCVFIGDAPNDWAAARNACVEFVGVRWAGQPDHLSEAERIPVLNTPRDLIDYLEATTPCRISS